MTRLSRQPIAWLALAVLVAAPLADGAAAQDRKAEREARKRRNAALEVVNEHLLAYKTPDARKELQPVYEDAEASTLIAMGRVLEQEKKYGDADQKLRKAAELQTDNPAPLIFLGESLTHQEKKADAKKVFEQAAERAQTMIKLDAKSVTGHYYLGVAQRYLGQYGPAGDSLGLARELDPANPMPVYQLGVLRTAQERWQPAVDLLTTAIGMESDIAYAYFFRGQAASKVGRMDMLIADFERFLQMAPDSPEAPAVRRIVSSVRR